MNILLTGGAGFVGSNLTKSLLTLPEVSKVVVLDNLSTGFLQNIEPFFNNTKFQFINGDISNYDTVLQAMQNIDLVSHQAALGSVPRSINNPVATNLVNINGTLNIYTAAKEAKVKRVVYAASSSTYGDSISLPKVENVIGKPLSPYAVTKYVMELYADVFAKTYDMEFIGLRYFNVFGPNQSPTGAYAAVIPLFMQSIINGVPPTINGDGTNSRDFTFIENAVQANIKALFTQDKNAVNQIYNIAYGQSTTLLQLYNYIKQIGQSNMDPIFGDVRAGDIPHSLANIEKAQSLLLYNPKIDLKAGLEICYQWYKNNPDYFVVQK
jgi:UDP-N-acetylglucosamine/UDP-N-acetylgalactosamine 4-epimerase